MKERMSLRSRHISLSLLKADGAASCSGSLVHILTCQECLWDTCYLLKRLLKLVLKYFSGSQSNEAILPSGLERRITPGW